MAAVTWGASVVLLVASDSPVHELFLGVVLAGIAAAGLVVLTPAPVVYTCFVITLLGPLAMWFMSRGDNSHVAMAVLVLLFALMMITIAGRPARRMSD